jgi:hypothetical protein
LSWRTITTAARPSENKIQALGPPALRPKEKAKAITKGTKGVAGRKAQSTLLRAIIPMRRIGERRISRFDDAEQENEVGTGLCVWQRA